jgi:sarcosine oxidase
MARQDYDVIVVGLGAMGSNALLHLAKAGVRVLGIEQFIPGHDRGASHGESRIIRTAYAEGAKYVPLLKRSWQLWDELEALSGQRLVCRTGGLVMAPAGSAPINAPVASATAHCLPFEILDADQMAARYPQHRLGADTAAFYEADAGVIRPEAAVVAAVDVARKLDAEVWSDTVVEKVVADVSQPYVVVDGEKIVASHVVVAAGAWITQLLPQAAPTLRVERRVFGWFDPKRPQDFTPERFPVFIRTDATGAENWYGLPGWGSPQVKVAIHNWPGLNEPVDPQRGARKPDNNDAKLISDIVEDTLPGLDPRPARLQACMYSLTPDNHFFVGGHPDLPGLTMLAGFSGHGFKMATVLGEITSQIVLHGQSELDISTFSLTRF